MADPVLKTEAHPDVSPGPPHSALSGAVSPWLQTGRTLGNACTCGAQQGALAFAVDPETFVGLLDISHAAASPSDLAFCPARCLVYMLHQGFCDT